MDFEWAYLWRSADDLLTRTPFLRPWWLGDPTISVASGALTLILSAWAWRAAPRSVVASLLPIAACCLAVGVVAQWGVGRANAGWLADRAVPGGGAGALEQAGWALALPSVIVAIGIAVPLCVTLLRAPRQTPPGERPSLSRITLLWLVLVPIPLFESVLFSVPGELHPQEVSIRLGLGALLGACATAGYVTRRDRAVMPLALALWCAATEAFSFHWRLVDPHFPSPGRLTHWLVAELAGVEPAFATFVVMLALCLDMGAVGALLSGSSRRGSLFIFGSMFAVLHLGNPIPPLRIELLHWLDENGWIEGFTSDA